MTKEEYWKKLEESPENQLYKKFSSRYGTDRRLPTSIREIPLIGIKKVRDPFDMDRDYYERPFFLFGPETPLMKGLSLDDAVERNLRFLGMIPITSWKGGSKISNLFYSFAKFFRDKKTPPDYFLVNFSADKYDTSDICHYTLTFFGR